MPWTLGLFDSWIIPDQISVNHKCKLNFVCEYRKTLYFSTSACGLNRLVDNCDILSLIELENWLKWLHIRPILHNVYNNFPSILTCFYPTITILFLLYARVSTTNMYIMFHFNHLRQLYKKKLLYTNVSSLW